MGTDIPLAIETIKKTMLADADENVWYVFAHDAHVREVLGRENFFPREANEWKKNGWREKLLWRFLEDFGEGVKEVLKGEKEEGKEKL